MRPASSLLAPSAAALLLAAVAIPAARQDETAAGPRLTVPAGFEVERVAGPPLVDRPIVADFDEQGRLYVADSSGSNDKVERQLAEKPHRIVRLEDTDGDGSFDRRTVFADRMMFPEGAMWFDGSLYVAAPPSIWKLTDTDGDGVADRREEWFEGKTLTGCANDLHGPYLGPDGWIYWTKGAFAEQTYERPGRPPFVTRAAHIFRRRPEGGPVEPVITGGMDNPVDVAFLPTGERILTATFLEHPQLGRRDALIHAVYGGLYGKPHGVLDGHPQTGDLMPALTHFGPAAPSGLAHYASAVFGEEYRDNLFAALFNLHKVTRHVLEPAGATFTSRDSDFLVSDSLDFHPTDVVEDADGSLLVIDTGAWYKLCCPTSQLAKPEVLGAIYRVRRKGAPRLKDPRGLSLAWASMTSAELTTLLDDRRPAVRNRAVHLLAKQGRPDIGALAGVLEGSSSAEARRNAVWALTRIDDPAARTAVRAALTDKDPQVRHAAIHSAGLWRDAEARAAIEETLMSGAPSLRRVAAEALGRIGDAAAVPSLLAAAAQPADRVLEHSMTYALIEIGDPLSTSTGLEATSPQTRRTALIALDQMPGDALRPEVVVRLLDSSDALLRDTAWWIARQHPEWGDALAAWFAPRLERAGDEQAQAALEDQLAPFGSSSAIRQLLADTLARSGSPATKRTVLRAMAASRPRGLPPAWVGPLQAVLKGSDDEAIRHAVAVARAASGDEGKEPALRDALLAVVRDESRALDVRLDALSVAQAGLTRVEPDLFELLRHALAPGQVASIRVAAAGILEKAPLEREQLLALTAVLRTSGPLELPRLLPAFDRGSDEALGMELLAALEASKARSSVRGELLRPRLATYPASVQARGEALLRSLDADTAQQAARLESLLGTLRGGDIRRGQAVFNSPKGACSSCHAIGYLGGRVGPDLTRIGEIRSERDLLEAIVFPSASFARGYEPVVVTTTGGAVHTGVLRGEHPDEIVLAMGERDEIRIPRADVEDMQPGSVSVMPPGLDEQLTRQELADLLAFLKATRWGAQ
ncbi:MAG TPA: PVC-type heme-binding CxxCH protein [Vicinamibacterales bacterium]